MRCNVAPVNAPRSWPKSSLSRKLFGNGRAIDREKRLLRAVAVMVNGAGDEFLAGAAFAGDERGGVAGGDLADELEHLLHRAAAADDAEFVILRFEQRLIRDDLFHVARGLECVADEFLDLHRVERLEQIIIRAELHRLDGGLRGAVGGHQDDELLGIGGADAAERFQTVHAAHAHVHQHEVGLEFGNDLQSFLAAGRGGELDFRRIKNPLERIPHVFFIINQQELAHLRGQDNGFAQKKQGIFTPRFLH
jgi:hypothetical protein